MEALGQLTAGVAHEFNNLLTVILGNASTLRAISASHPGGAEQRKLQMIELAAQRGGRLAAQLLAFSRKQMLKPEILSVYDVLAGSQELIAQAAGDGIATRLEADADLWTCLVDQGQLISAILNGVLNARDAMPSGGELTIRCRNQRADLQHAARAGGKPGDYVRVDLIDTGVGIAADLLERVFEPFFTTKPFGTASGLGLAQVHGFAGQSGGWVELTSTVDQGTTLSFLLPRADRLISSTDATPANKEPPPVAVSAAPEIWFKQSETIQQLHDLALRGPLPRLGSRLGEGSGKLARSGPVRLGVAPIVAADPVDAGSLSAGLAEELTTALSRFRWIACVSPTSVAVRQDYQGLNLDYLIEGTYRRNEGGIRITVRLINMRQCGEITWTKRYGADMSNALAVHDQIAADAAAEIAPELLVLEGDRATRSASVHPTAYELVLRAIPAIYRLDREGFRGARPLLKQALSLDPTSAPAHSWLSHWYLLLIGQGWALNMERAARQALRLAERAIVLDPGDARALTVAGHINAFLFRRPDEALRLHASALDLNPNLALAWCFAGLANSYAGRHAEAVEQIQRARQLSPHDPHGFFFDMAMVMPLLLTGDHENAVRSGQRARRANPGLSSSYKGLIAALGYLGQAREARCLIDELYQVEPGFTVREAISRSPLMNPNDLACYAQGLRLAGLREGAATIGELPSMTLLALS